jgi:surface antigen
MRLSAMTAALGAGLLLAGCVGNGGGGMLAPAGTAGAAGNAGASAPPPGAIAAGLVGSSVGTGLSAQDQQRALAAEYQALEFGVAGVAVTWSSGGVSGTVVPGPLYTVNEYECRDYTHTIVISGATEAGRGTACSRAGAAWEIAA